MRVLTAHRSTERILCEVQLSYWDRFNDLMLILSLNVTIDVLESACVLWACSKKEEMSCCVLLAFHVGQVRLMLSVFL